MNPEKLKIRCWLDYSIGPDNILIRGREEFVREYGEILSETVAINPVTFELVTVMWVEFSKEDATIYYLKYETA